MKRTPTTVRRSFVAYLWLPDQADAAVSNDAQRCACLCAGCGLAEELAEVSWFEAARKGPGRGFTFYPDDVS